MARKSRIINADAIEGLAKLPDNSVHCVITSPPYWGLRDYQTTGQIGLESTPDEYVARMVGVFREVRRVLRDDGVCWLNLGDSYAAARGGTYMPAETLAGGEHGKTSDGETVNRGRHNGRSPSRDAHSFGLKHKDLVGIPWRVAFALQADGWWLRRDVIWAKGMSDNPDYVGSCMPESVNGFRWERHQVTVSGERIECNGCEKCNPNDGWVLKRGSWRPTTSHEYLFMLTKSEWYICDQEAVREVGVFPAGTIAAKGSGNRQGNRRGADYATYSGTRNRRSVWAIQTKPYKAAHFATFPEKLAKTCLLAGTSSGGCCTVCGTPFIRMLEKTRTFESGSGKAGNLPDGKNGENLQGGGETRDIRRGPCVTSTTVGWKPICDCVPANPVPCTVLDPFAGSGTVGVVAKLTNRRFIGIDINQAYCQLSRSRIHDTQVTS